jgi:CRISPR/Cas system-associated protein Cas10 (large subunit of type III CRISPR-Cas system)
MKRTLLALVAACFAVTAPLPAQTSNLAPAVAGADTNAPAATPRKKGLGSAMKKMGRALKRVKEQVADPTKKDDTLAALAELRASLETAQGMGDKALENIPPADHAKYKESYAKRMTAVAELVGKLEAAVKADKTDEAQALIKQLLQERTDGHEEFKVD